jgi:hypothetical protein
LGKAKCHDGCASTPIRHCAVNIFPVRRLLLTLVLALSTQPLLAQTVVSNRVVSPEERARNLRIRFSLSSEQEKQFIDLYKKADSLRAEIKANPSWPKEKWLAKYDEWRSVMQEGRRRILTKDQYSAYMADVQAGRDRLAAQGSGMSIQEQLTWLREKDAAQKSQRDSEPALNSAQRKDLEANYNTSPMEDSFAFSRLHFKFVGRLTFNYQPAQALDQMVADIRVKGINTETNEKTVLVPSNRIICNKVASEDRKANVSQRGPEYAHTYEFHFSAEVLPPKGIQFFNSGYFRNIDCITVTISKPEDIPVGGKLGDFDFAHYDRTRAAELWASWPVQDQQHTGAITLTTTHATTSAQLALVDRPLSNNTWSDFIRDPDRAEGSGPPILVAEGTPHLDFHCDYLMSLPEYKVVAFPILLKTK